MTRPKPVESLILTIRRRKVMIDADLAGAYGAETRSLNQAVKRNAERFPEDFVFRLNAGEKLEVITICDHLTHIKFAKSLPYAFTEHGAIMAATMLDLSYADFNFQLDGGRSLAVDYKGKDRYSGANAEERRAISEVWATRSGGKACSRGRQRFLNDRCHRGVIMGDASTDAREKS